jgi:lysyl-tRNA synthetase class 2
MAASSRSQRKNALLDRSRIITIIRRFFEDRGFLDIETPCRIPAPAPEPYIDALPSGEWYLQTSPELAMKRLLAAGHEKIFQICRCWRDGERGRFHLPEFTMLEWYRADADYTDLMTDCEELLRDVVAAVPGATRISFQGIDVDVALPATRLTVREAFLRYTGRSAEEALDADCFDELMVEKIEPRLGVGAPTILYDYPAARGALSRRKSEDPSLTERFELYLCGVELANAFSELTDPEEQRERFRQDREERRLAGKDPYPLPQPFLDDLTNMPPSAGIALGIDRLVMLLLDAPAIDDVVAFTPEEL